MISRSLASLTLTSIITLFLITKAPRGKEDRDPDTWTHYTTGTGIDTLFLFFEDLFVYIRD